MKKAYIKPITRMVAIDNENALMAGSQVNLGYDNSEQITTDEMVGAKNEQYDIWGFDDDED